MPRAPIHDGELSDGHPLKEGTPQPAVVGPADVADDHAPAIANQLRALQREVRSGFELITTRLETMMDRFAERQEDHAHRIDQLERDRARTDQRLAALEARPKRTRKARK